MLSVQKNINVNLCGSSFHQSYNLKILVAIDEILLATKFRIMSHGAWNEPRLVNYMYTFAYTCKP